MFNSAFQEKILKKAQRREIRMTRDLESMTSGKNIQRLFDLKRRLGKTTSTQKYPKLGTGLSTGNVCLQA